MQLTLGFVRSASQVLLKDFDWDQNQVSTRIIDVTDLTDQGIQGLFVGETEHFGQLMGILEKEKTHSPILEAAPWNLTLDEFEKMPAFQFKELTEKVQARWQMAHNFQSLENLCAMNTHMRTLWHKDRLAFFEELWFWLKRNLAAVDLSLVFNDVVQAEVKNEEGGKEARPKLTQSLLTGRKTANFIPGGGREQELMERYLDKWNEGFEVTEWDPKKGRFVATVMLERSPIIIMGRVTALGQMQRSLLTGLFQGLQGT